MEGLEDDPIAQKMLMVLVTTKGHQVEQVGQPKQANGERQGRSTFLTVECQAHQGTADGASSQAT